MNNKKVSLAVLLSCIGMFAIGAVQAGEDAKTAVDKIDVTAAKDYVAENDNAVILDVRTPAEYDMSHITGAMNVNVLDDDFASMIAGLDKDRTYLVHCTKNPENGRSSRALEAMQGLGFKNLYNLEGGYVAWKEAELPLTEADN